MAGQLRGRRQPGIERLDVEKSAWGNPEGQKFIETVSRRGYLFIPRVTGVQRDAQLIVQENSSADVVAEETGFLEPYVESAHAATQESSV